MNPRLAKELRPLLLPWGVAALAAAGHFVALADANFAKGAFGSFLTGLAGVAFVVGCLVLTAMPMGFELQENTLTLLLSQPTDRTQLWRDKLLMATMAVVALAAVHGLASGVVGQLRLSEALLFSAFMSAAICSVGYWTLATRSILIGIVCALSVPVWIASSAHVIVRYFLGIEVKLSEQADLVFGLGLSVAYCAFFLWLGRRQFADLELKGTSAARAAQIPQALVPRNLAEVVRSRPTGGTANLIRKEVCLQKPIFLVSGIFTVSWLLTLLLMVLRPAWQNNCVAVLNGLTGTQIVLMVILAGCVSLGDDKALGTTAWHLTLPVSTRRQWFVKLLVSAATAIAMAIVLPTLLAALTLFEARVGLLALPDEVLGLVIPCAVVFVLSFWSASMVTNTVRAALTIVLSGVALGTIVSVGIWTAEKLGGLQTGLLTSLIARYQWSPYSLHGIIPAGRIAFGLIGLGMFIALVQSFRQFRRAQPQSAALFRYATVLALVAFTVAFWTRDVHVSMGNQGPNSPLVVEVQVALLSIPLNDADLSNPRRLTAGDLEKTGLLSKRTSQWLRNATIEVSRVESESKSRHFTHWVVYSATINFPNGMSLPFTWSIPKPKAPLAERP